MRKLKSLWLGLVVLVFLRCSIHLPFGCAAISKLLDVR